MSEYRHGIVAGLTEGDLLIGWPCRHKDSANSSGGGGTHFSLCPIATRWEGRKLWVATLNHKGLPFTFEFNELEFDPNWKRE